jgi:hypothetical protein
LVIMLLFGMLLLATITGKALDREQLTVVTTAQDGSWGVATAGSRGRAIVASIRDCRAMFLAATDCGGQFTTTRGGCVIASFSGDHELMVAADNREAAKPAALNREVDPRLPHV